MKRPHSLVVTTLDSDSNSPSSNLGVASFYILEAFRHPVCATQAHDFPYLSFSLSTTIVGVSSSMCSVLYGFRSAKLVGRGAI
jgi:hypothetical protein